MKKSLRIFRVQKIPISIHWTFLFLIAWIVLVTLRTNQDWMAVVWSLIFTISIFICIICHELGHSLVAQRFGIKIKSITLYPIGGIAQLESFPKNPKQELLITLAGPVVNLIIAALLYPFTDFPTTITGESLHIINGSTFLQAFVLTNFVLAFFNLIPAFPMDGGRIFRAVLSFFIMRERATQIAIAVGQVIAIGFIGIGFYGNPMLTFIGLFVLLESHVEGNLAKVENLLAGTSLDMVTMLDVPVLPLGSSLGDAERKTLQSQQKNFLVVDHDAIVGTLNQDQLVSALTDYAADTPIDKVIDHDVLYLPYKMPVEEAMLTMQTKHKSMAIVMDENERVGIVDDDNLAEFIQLQNARRKFEKTHS